MDAPEQHNADAPGSENSLLTRLKALFETELPVSDEEQADLVRRSGDPRLARARRCLTETEIGDRIGYSAKYVGQVRTGYRANPSRTFLERFARLYDKPVEWLSGGTLPPESREGEPAQPLHPLTRKLQVLFATPVPVSDARQAELRLRSGDPDLPRACEPLKDTEIARAIGATPTYVGQLKSGRRTNPSLDVLQAIANLYKKPIGDLVTEHADYDAPTMSQRVAGLFLSVDGEGAQSLRFTPERVAAEIGVDPAQLRALCAGALSADEVPVSLPAKLAEFFGVSLGYLLGGVGEPSDTVDAANVGHWMQDLLRSETLTAAARRLSEMTDQVSRQRFLTTMEKVVDAVMEMDKDAAEQAQPRLPRSSAQ